MKVTVPTSLSDIKLSQYQKFIRTTKDSKDDNFVARQMVGIFCNLTDEQVKNIAANSFDDLVNSITSVLIKEPEFKSTFNLDGVDYGFIPNLDEITLGEKVDLDSYYQDLETMDKAMAILYRPIKIKKRDKYLIEDYTGDANSIDPTLDIVFGANFFFLNLMNELLNYIPNFIEQEVVHNQKALQILEQNGDGIVAFTNSLREMFEDLKKLLNLNYSVV